MALDEKLFAALPESIRGPVCAFHPGGWFDLTTFITMDEAGSAVVHESTITLADVVVRHDQLPVAVEGIEGTLHVDHERMIIDGVAGRYNNASVTANGTVTWAGPGLQTELSLRCSNLALDERLCGFLPGRLRQVLTDWRVDGPIGIEAFVQTDSGGEHDSLAFDGVARLNGVSVRHPLFPAPFEDVQAEIHFDKSGSWADEVQARYGTATVVARFQTQRSDMQETGTISLVANDVTLDSSLRDLLPEAARISWDRLAPKGQVDVLIDRLHYDHLGTDQRPVWSVAGRLQLSSVSLHGGVPAQGLTGTVEGKGWLRDRSGGTSLSGSLHLSTAELFSRQLTDVATPWSYAQVPSGRGRFALDSVHAKIYEGLLRGHLEVTLEPEGAKFNLSAKIHGFQAEPFLNGGSPTPRAPERPVKLSGVGDASLYLSGVAGDSSALRGGGRFEIQNGHMHRLPLILAILHVLNLSLSDAHAFDSARGDFFIVGNRVELTDLVLGGRALTLVGSGSMSLPDGSVELGLISVPSAGWATLPVLGDLVQRASRELVELQVTGPLSRPDVRAVPFRALTAELKELFQKRKPRNLRAAGS